MYCDGQIFYDSDVNTVKLGFKERLDKEQLANSEPFPVTNIPVHLLDSEHLCDDQKVPYYQVRMYLTFLSQ